ncbi:MAG: baseplate J/gp47 family protein [Vicingaceae bacterium]
MAVTIPTIQQLYQSVLADLESQLGITIPLFGKNFLRALAATQAAKLKLIYLAIGDVQKNIFVDTADPQSLGGTLERFGLVKLGRLPFPATPGTYTIEITGDIGATIPANSTFKSNDDSLNPGKLFILDAPYTLISTTDAIDVRSLEAGLVSQLNIGDGLTATAPIANVDSNAIVTVEVIEPLAAEDVEDYRNDCINAFQLEAQGGAATDYRLWASDAQGVAKVYPYAKPGVPSEIDLYVEATKADSTDGKGTPSVITLFNVETVVEFDPDTTKPLNERGRRPISAFQINFLPIIVREIQIDIPNYVDSTTDKENAINAALEVLIDSIRPFVDSAETLDDKNDILDINRIAATILEAVPGSLFDTPILRVDAVQFSSFQFIDGDIPNLDSVNYV